MANDEPPTTDKLAGTQAPEQETSIVSVLGLALLGGLLLNIMPCVLPVLALKLYGLIEQQDISTNDRQMAGLAYTAGILFCFWVLAAAVFGTRSVLGIDVGWGFQFQYPPYIAGLATLVFAFGLSLFGLFEIPAFGVDQASNASSKEGPAGYFFTGMFATLVATPCTAPFMGTALAFAFGAPGYMLVLVFSLIGLGLASPFLLIAFVPSLYRFLPRPGAWMEAFKQFLGFTLVATTIWLVGVLTAQIGADRSNSFLAFLMFVALGCWVFGRWGGLGATRIQQLKAFAAGLLITVGGGWLFLDLEMAEASQCDDGSLVEVLDFEHDLPWQAFSEERVKALAGQPIFIDFTADWCLTCKANEKAVINTAPVREAMRDHDVIPLMADWTRRDPVITEWLKRHGKAGVPFYLVLPADASAAPIALPEVITQDMVIQAIKKANPKN
jgi:thiol:disulfide interchange protein DsbD